jgi:hypothetical protein
MRANEFLNEALMDSGIRKVMTKKGYKFLGHGQDQDAYRAPDGTILKIFGYESGSHGYSFGQQSFIDFAQYCMKNEGNPFLPQFGGWSKFEFNGNTYLQIKCERLFDIDRGNTLEVAELLEVIADTVNSYGAAKGMEKFLSSYVDDDWGSPDPEVGKLITLLGGEEQIKLFAKTVEDLSRLAKAKRYRFDLHSGNFMLGSDGEIVINDPFFTGTWR